MKQEELKIFDNHPKRCNIKLQNIRKGNEHKPITNSHLAHVLKEIPFTGAIRFTLSDGSKLMAAKHDYVKNETYDVYWTE